jgi:hypothetical protein
LCADNYLLSNLIWFYVFDLTGDERPLLKMGIHAFMTKSIEIQGPWGGRVSEQYGGFPFFDGPATGIKGLKIKSQSRVLWSLSVEYDACGESFQSVPHGEPPFYVTEFTEDEVSFTCISQGFLVSSC